MKDRVNQKRTLFPILVFFVSVLVVLFTLSLYRAEPALAQSENSKLLTYTNTNLGFTFKYPSDWNIYVYEGETGGVITLQSYDKVGSVLVSVDTLKPNETGLTLEQFAKNYAWSWGSVASKLYLILF